MLPFAVISFLRLANQEKEKTIMQTTREERDDQAERAARLRREYRLALLNLEIQARRMRA
jgi:hypothetical protein